MATTIVTTDGLWNVAQESLRQVMLKRRWARLTGGLMTLHAASDGARVSLDPRFIGIVMAGDQRPKSTEQMTPVPIAPLRAVRSDDSPQDSA